MSEDGAEFIDLSRDDEDFVTCQICFTNFDEGEHVPKYLECKHVFCLTCIKSLNCRKKVTCPSCRAISNLGRKKFEDLTTNHVALRLLKVIEKSQRKGKKGANQNKWCSECNTAASQNCICRKHQIANFDDIYRSHCLLLKDITINCNAACDRALQSYNKIQSVYGSVLSRIQWLESEMTQKVESNNTSIAHLESLKSDDCVDAFKEKDMNVTSMNEINQLVVKFNDSSSTAKAVEFKTQDWLQTYGRKDLDFLITLLKGQKSDPSENFPSAPNVSNSSTVLFQDTSLITEPNKGQGLQPPQCQLPKRQGKEPAESDMQSIKKIKLQEPTDQLKISTENVLRKVDCRVQQEVMTLESKGDSNSTITKSVQQPAGINNAVGKVQQKGGRQYHPQQNNSRVQRSVSWVDVTIQLQSNSPFFTVQKFKHLIRNFLKGKKEIDMPNLFKCNRCKKAIGDLCFYYCLECNDYQLCVSCNENETHPHKIEIFGFDLANDGYQYKIGNWVSSFHHAITCHYQQCAFLYCGEVKRAFVHSKNCLKPTVANCSVCNQLLAILTYHGMSCSNNYCRIPHCRYNPVRNLIASSIQQDSSRTVYMRQTMTSQNGTPSSYGVYGQLNNYNMPYPMYYPYHDNYQ